MKFKKMCAYCGNVFYAKRSSAKTCSNTCRVYYNREKESKPDNAIELLTNVITGNLTAFFPEDNDKSKDDNVIKSVTSENISNITLETEVEKRYKEQARKNALTYTEETCYLCGKEVHLTKNTDKQGKKIACNDCIPFYYSCVYAINRNVISPEGLDVYEAMKKIKNN